MFAFSTAAPLPCRSSQPLALSSRRVSCAPRSAPRRAPRAPPRMALDPHTLHHVASSFAVAPHIDLHSLQLVLADAAAAVSDTAAAAVDTAVEAKKSGWWDSFVNLVETAIVSLHGRLSAAGVPGAYGLSIILFTVVIKAFTFPLNFRQMESTMRMQAIAPRLKKIQADYKDNPQVMNQMTAQLYKDEQINPLAGCLPVIVQIPVWIALYRSVLNLAADNLLNESFLWLPSLQGPVSKTGQGLNTWLFPLQNGAPPIGWHDAACYLVLPVVLVATQFVSQRVISPPNQDPSQQQANAILKFMPFLIGWFALNVPSGLGVYWVTNNLLSTAQTIFIRSRFPELSKPPSDSSASSTDAASPPVSRLDIADGFRSNGTDAPKKTTKSKKRRKRR